MPLVLPAGHESSVLVVSMSGGKDSTATALLMREAGIPCRYVFADTGWEAQETYDYLDMLRARLGIAIDVVGALMPPPSAPTARRRARHPSPTSPRSIASAHSVAPSLRLTRSQ